MLADQALSLTRLHVAVGFQLAVDQIAVDHQLETSPITGNERDLLDIRLKGSQDFFRHTDGAG